MKEGERFFGKFSGREKSGIRKKLTITALMFTTVHVVVEILDIGGVEAHLVVPPARKSGNATSKGVRNVVVLV